MNFRGIFWLVLLLSLIVSIGFVSATDVNDTTTDSMMESSEINLTDIGENNLEISQENQISSQEDNSRVIYVGQNITDDGGKGSYENPFSTLKLACDNVSGEDKVTVNIFNGTYLIGSHLKFDTNNLFINGLGNVIIKNQFDSTKYGNQALGLKSSSANFTMSNIIFDASNWTQRSLQNYFTSFRGNANFGTYINCTFTGFKKAYLAGANEFNANFTNCIFEGFKERMMFNDHASGSKFIYFENCIFLDNNLELNLFFRIYADKNVSMNGVWFGQNGIPDYVLSLSTIEKKVNPVSGKVNEYSAPPRDLPITKYAIFSVSENYLGNNQFEIIGKLCWNGTNESVGDSFAPMTVILSSETGQVDSTATLKNGIFRTIYNSTTSENSIKVTLDDEEIDSEFNIVDIQVESPSIFSGDTQNITITLPQAMNAIVSITVNNKTYDIKVNNSDFINYTIDDVILTEGKYDVNVTLADLKNHVYGFNSTELVVSKISQYAFNVAAPSEVGQGNNANLLIELPDDVSGVVVISVGDDYSISYSVNGSFDADVLIPKVGDNKIIVNYSGDNRYVPDLKEVHINAYDTVPSIEIIVPNDVKVGDSVDFGFILPNDATGTILVTVGETKYWEKLTQGKANIKIPNIYENSTVNVEYLGDNRYDRNTNSSDIIVYKIYSNVNVETFDAVWGNNATVVVSLPPDATGNIKIYIDGVIVAESSIINGQSIIPITDLPIGDYNITILYSGDDKYQESSNVGNISILKISPYFHIENITNITVGEVAIIEINVTDEIADDVKLTVDGENVQYEIKDNGIIIANINELNAGNHTVKVAFEGNGEYYARSAEIYFIVSKISNYSANLTIGEANIEKTNIHVELPNDATGNITFTIDGTPLNPITISNILILENLNPGKHNISALYSGDEKYKEYEFKGFTFEVNKLYEIPKLTLPEYNEYSNKTSMTINLPGDANGNVTITVDKQIIENINLINATAIITLPENLTVGMHEIIVKYNGDDKYNESHVNTTLNIIKAQPSIMVNDIQSVVGETATLNIMLPSDATGIVLININNTSYSANIEYGIANLSISNLKEGIYSVNVKYLGDNNYNNVSIATTIKIDTKNEAPLNINIPSDIQLDGDNIININAPSDAKGNITLKIDGKIVNIVPVVNGNVNLSLSNLSMGNHIVEVLYSGDEKYVLNSSTFIYSIENELIIIVDGIEYPTDVVNGTATINTNKTEIPTAIIVDGVEYPVSVLNGTVSVITNKSDVPVTVVVDGVEYPVSVLNGTAIIKTNNASSQNTTETKLDTILTADAKFSRVAVDYNAGERGAMFYAILKDSNGNVLANKTVQIAINGKIYNKTTDVEGRAGLQINFAAANTYSYAISFQGDDTYNAAPIAASKLTVTKKKTTIKATNKVFKAKTKIKKIRVTLKTVKNQYDNKTYLKSGKKVTLKVNGKTYTAKINKKGVAKFTIKITKKGKYTAKIKFTGDKTYKASSKTIKIRIK